MPDVLVRNIESDVLEALKKRASLSGRSLQAELKSILLEEASQISMVDARLVAARIRRSLREGKYSDSAGLLKEDRAR